VDRIERNMETLVGVVRRVADLQEGAQLQIGRLTEAQLRLTENQARLEMAQAETTDKLNALIGIVDERIRRRPPNGQNPPALQS